MKAIEIRNKYLNFFKAHGHVVIPSAPLIPENDPSVLFTTAGMQPLVPYLLGEPHPSGTRLTDYQKCVRTNDIDEVGDNRHLTYFEMLGNWSLGDYFKGYIPNEILDNHTARGSQGADFNFRVNRDWDKIKNQVLEILNEPLLLEYLDKKKIDDLIHTISQNEYNLDKTMVAEATVIGALGYFLRHHAGGN